MKSTFLSLCAMLLFVMAGKAHAQVHPFGTLESNYTTIVGGNTFTFKKDTYLGGSGKTIQWGNLAMKAPVSIGGTDYICRANRTIDFYSNGMIRTASLAEKATATLNGTDYTFKSISFDGNGKIIGGRLAKKVTVNIHGNDYTFRSLIGFGNNGRIRSGSLAKDVKVNVGGTPYTFNGGWSEHSFIHFYPDGTIREGCLARKLTVTIGDVQYDFRIVSFDQSGKIIGGAGGLLAQKVALSLNGINYTFILDSERIYFHTNGTVKKGRLAEDVMATVDGINYTFSNYNFVDFHSNGQIIQGRISKPYEGWVRFYSDGTLAGTGGQKDWTGEH